MYSYALRTRRRPPDRGRRQRHDAEGIGRRDGRRVQPDALLGPAGFPGPELHTHAAFDEAFYVLDGELDIRIGERVETLGPGAFAYVRGSEPHTFANSSERVANVMLTCTPGGFEAYFEELAAIGGMPDPETRSRIAAKFGVIPTK